MEITVYSHHRGMCEDGGQIFKPAADNPVRDAIERVLALLSHKQDIRLLATAVSKKWRGTHIQHQNKSARYT